MSIGHEQHVYLLQWLVELLKHSTTCRLHSRFCNGAVVRNLLPLIVTPCGLLYNDQTMYMGFLIQPVYVL